MVYGWPHELFMLKNSLKNMFYYDLKAQSNLKLKKWKLQILWSKWFFKITINQFKSALFEPNKTIFWIIFPLCIAPTCFFGAVICGSQNNIMCGTHMNFIEEFVSQSFDLNRTNLSTLDRTHLHWCDTHMFFKVHTLLDPLAPVRVFQIKNLFTKQHYVRHSYEYYEHYSNVF